MVKVAEKRASQQRSRGSESRSELGGVKLLQKKIWQDSQMDRSDSVNFSLELERYQFSMLYDIDAQFLKHCKKLKIRRCFFMELFRKVLVLKLNKIGIYTREFYSEDLRFINCALKVQDAVLVERAETYEVPMELELGTIDLFSLEPVDDQFRPIRHKEKTFKEWEKEKKLTQLEVTGKEIQDVPLAALEAEKIESGNQINHTIVEDEIDGSVLNLPTAASKIGVVTAIKKNR